MLNHENQTQLPSLPPELAKLMRVFTVVLAVSHSNSPSNDRPVQLKGALKYFTSLLDPFLEDEEKEELNALGINPASSDPDTQALALAAWVPHWMQHYESNLGNLEIPNSLADLNLEAKELGNYI